MRPDWLPNSADVLDAIGAENKDGSEGWLYQPKTEWGKAASNVAAFLPGAVAGPGSVTANLVRYGVVPGLMSEGAGQVARQVAPDYEGAARFAGGLLGTVGGRKIVSPNLDTAPAATAAERAAAVDTLRGEGVYPHPGQVSGKKNTSFLYDELNPERYGEQREAFTRAAMRRAGVDDLATTGQGGNIPRIMQEASNRYEAAIRRAGPGVGFDSQLRSELLSHLNEATKPGLYETPVTNAVVGAVQRTVDMIAANGQMPTRQYQTLRSDLAQTARETQDPRLKRLMYGMVQTLDDATARHLARIGEDPRQFRDAADFYKRMLTLKEAATNNNAQAAIGHITPSKLGAAAEAVYGRDSVARGDNPFSRLARAGEVALGEMASSGTSERQHVRDMMKAPSSVASILVGGPLGYHVGGEFGGLTGLWLSDKLAPWLDPASRAAMRAIIDNPLARRYFGNQFAADTAPLASPQGLLTPMTAERQAEETTRQRKPLQVTVSPGGVALPDGTVIPADEYRQRKAAGAVR
jgi:hypothetical protein